MTVKSELLAIWTVLAELLAVPGSFIRALGIFDIFIILAVFDFLTIWQVSFGSFDSLIKDLGSLDSTVLNVKQFGSLIWKFSPDSFDF